VLIVPGFFAVDPGGRCVLLGRGGSDHTALFVAHILEADCVLLKDVFGIYDRDPAEPGPATHRFERISWADAIGVGGKLIQPKALRFAAMRQQPFSISTPGCSIHTLIGGTSAPPVEMPQPPRPLRVVLLGLGTVGFGVYRELERRADRFEVVRIAVRHLARHTVAGLPSALLTTDVQAAVSESADLVVEVMGGDQPAGAAIAQALKAGRTVVTANKALIATRNPFFDALAERHRTSLRYSAAVGGAVPMIERVRLAALEGGSMNPVVGIRGILNGTCNFVLELLERGTSLSEAIELAQAKGFAEADPMSDLSGADAAAKLKVLVEAAHGTADVSAVMHSGIDQSTPERARKTREAGRVLRLVATYRGGAHIDPILQVSLADLHDDWLASCVGEENRLEIHHYDSSIIRVSGRGAGRWPTTLAVMADIYDVWRDWTGSQQITSERHTA
jgi:homoserine dehydrogenase